MPIRASLKRSLLILAAGVACGGGTTEPKVDNDTVITAVTIAATATTLEPGTTAQLTATARNSAGGALPGAATWSSSNQAVATVSGTGLVTAVANGNATITATISGVTGTRSIVVGKITPEGDAVIEASGTTFTPSQVDILVGGQVTWTFNGEHNVTFTTAASAPSNIPNTSSGSVSRTFNDAGNFIFNCTLHPGMQGTVIVH
jgi:plastocyanin